MTAFAWADALDGAAPPPPRPGLSLRALVDPGAVELRFRPRDRKARSQLTAALGMTIPMLQGASAESGQWTVLWTGYERRLVLAQRANAPLLAATLREALEGRGAALDLTGAFAMAVLDGAEGHELLGRLGPVDRRRLADPGSVAELALAGAPVVAHRPQRAPETIQLLLPRSRAADLFARMAAAFARMGR